MTKPKRIHTSCYTSTLAIARGQSARGQSVGGGMLRSVKKLASLCLAGFLALCISGCTQTSERPSLGDWLRGNHKPLTPNDSDLYPPPPPSSVSANYDPVGLNAQAVHLDGSMPDDARIQQVRAATDAAGRYVNQHTADARYVARQFPQTDASAASEVKADPPTHVVAPSPYRFSTPQGPPLPPGTAVTPQRPPPGQVNNYLPPSQANGGQGYAAQPFQAYPPQAVQYNQPYSAQQQPQAFTPAPAQPVPTFTETAPQLNPFAGQSTVVTPPAPAPTTTFAPPPTATTQIAPPVVRSQPSRRAPVSPRPTFVPGAGTAFPPVGTDPIYSPTLRYADLIINGFPARTGRIMLGGAVNSDAGVTGQITIDERNFDIRRWPRSFGDMFTGQAFRGAGETFRIEAAPGSDFDRYTAQWATPNLFNYLPFSLSVSGFLYDRRFNDWDENRKGGRVSLGYRVTPDLSVSVGFSGQEVDLSNPRNALSQQLNDALGESTLLSGSVSLKHDTRNSPIQASRGHYFDFSYEQVFGDFDYSRFELEFRQYWQLAERVDGSGKQTLSFSTKLGFSGDETPVFENFFAGGYATIRGFDFRGASPLENGVEVGGEFQWLNTLEYMFPITADDAFRGVAFVDFGTVEQSVEINEDNFRVAPGVGLRVAIPALGPAPLAFDFAFPVAKAATDDERIFSFYMSLIR